MLALIVGFLLQHLCDTPPVMTEQRQYRYTTCVHNVKNALHVVPQKHVYTGIVIVLECTVNFLFVLKVRFMLRVVGHTARTKLSASRFYEKINITVFGTVCQTLSVMRIQLILLKVV